MAKCWYCKRIKGKRYCSPIENILCPICCSKNRLNNIDCNEDCKYLAGVVYQKEKVEEKEFSKLMESVPHGQYDDIFQDEEVAMITIEIETFIRDIYIKGDVRITDKLVYESYKKIYQKYFRKELLEQDKLDEVTKDLLIFFDNHTEIWEYNMEKAKIGQIFLRLMLSIKNMTGGKLGEFGYLNYLKNNLSNNGLENQYIIEDKFGNKTIRGLGAD